MKISCINILNDEKTIFDNIEEASKKTGVKKRQIQRVLKNEQKTAGIYKWYLEKVQNLEPENNLLQNYEQIKNNKLLLEEFKNFLIQRNNSNVIKPKQVFIEPYLNGNPDNILIIGDIHEPFCLEDYLKFARKKQEEYNCGTVVFIGDIIDNHYSSFHDTDPDGMSALDEFKSAKNKLKRWYYTFPKAKVCIGNHDAIICRKLFKSGISNLWVKNYNEILETPNWDFQLEFEINNTLFVHGTGSSGSDACLRRVLTSNKNIVQGHIHTEGFVRYITVGNKQLFGMQTGCGIDENAYAFAYAKTNFKKNVLGLGVIYNETPIFISYTK